jgi:hypothetical protein
MLRLIDRLPVATRPGPVQARETISTPTGSFDVRLSGDARGIDQGLGVIATRMAWYVAAMLGAIVLAWLVIEVGLIRRITVLTRRAAAVSHNVQRDAQGDARIGELDVSDLRGKGRTRDPRRRPGGPAGAREERRAARAAARPARAGHAAGGGSTRSSRRCSP